MYNNKKTSVRKLLNSCVEINNLDFNFDSIKKMYEKIIFDDLGLDEIKLYKDPILKKNIGDYIKNRDGYKCLCCGMPEFITVNYIIPSSLGGIYGIDNLQTLCESCRTEKGDKIIDYRGAQVIKKPKLTKNINAGKERGFF